MADITARIKLDGEAAFKRGINDAKNSVKSLDEELRLSEAQFKATGDKQTYMKTRGDLLKKQLEQQKVAVDTAKKALAECAKQGLSENSTKTMEWRGKLAQAQTKMLQLNTAIKNNEKGLDSAGKSYDTYKDKADGATDSTNGMKDALNDINTNISLQNVSAAIGKINDAIDKGVQKTIQFGKALWTMTADSTAWADDLATKSATSGIDTTTLQQWEYAARFIDTDVDAIIGARKKLVAGMGKGGDLDKALEEMGISATDSEGNLRDYYDVLWDVLGGLGDLDESAREQKAMEIFGKSYADLLPLISAGREEWDKYANRAPVVSEGDLKKLTEANDALEDLDANLEMTKNTLLAQLAPALKTVAEALTGALQSLNEYLATEEGQAKMQAFSDAVVRLATNIFDIDWGKAIEGVSKAFDAITGALEWIIKNKELVLAALGAIAAARFWGMLSSAGSSAMSLWNGLKGLMHLGGGGAAGAAGSAGAGGGAGAAGAGGAAAGAGKAKVASFASSLGTAIGSAAGLNTTGTAALGAAGIGFTAGIMSVVGLAKAFANTNTYSKQAYDADRYNDDPLRERIEYANWQLHHGTGSNGKNAESAMRTLATAAESAEEWFKIFDYTDEDRGSANYLTDLVGGTNWEVGNNKQVAAAIYNSFAERFGELGTAAGDAALASLPPEMQAAIKNGREARQELLHAGSELDSTALYTYLDPFFAMNGITDRNPYANKLSDKARAELEAAAQGATTSTWESAADVINRDAKDFHDVGEIAAAGFENELNNWSGWQFYNDSNGGYWANQHNETGEVLYWDKANGFYETDFSEEDLMKEFVPEELAPAIVRALEEETGENFGLDYDALDGMIVIQPTGGEGGQGEPVTVEDVADLVGSAISGVTVTMDGVAVGKLVSPTVSDILARRMQERW